MHPDWLAPHAPVLTAVVALFHPHVEVVAHDVRRDRVVAIWNPLSGRTIGDPSLLEPELLHATRSDAVVGPYPKVDEQGGRWTSVSVPLGEGRGLLCINFDRSALDGAAELLTRFAAAVQPRPDALFVRDWRHEVNVLVDDWCRTSEVARSRLTRPQRLELVAHLDGKGVFAVRHAAGQVATALGVSRATVYDLLKTVRSPEEPR
jgi:predicted transcriptional regulator YheO